MKYLMNRKLWAAIIGLVTAFGTLMVTIDEVKAYPVTTNYSVVSSSYTQQKGVICYRN